MKSIVPKHLHEGLKPDTGMNSTSFALTSHLTLRLPAIGCRRVIRDPNYYKALSQPNVELEWDHIARVVPDGVVLKKSQKHVKLDVIVTAIGFKSDATISLPLVGRDGVSMEDYWTAQGGPTAYMGLNMPHFPNMFTLLGPNSSAGHASVVFYEEIQVH